MIDLNEINPSLPESLNTLLPKSQNGSNGSNDRISQSQNTGIPESLNTSIPQYSIKQDSIMMGRKGKKHPHKGRKQISDAKRLRIKALAETNISATMIGRLENVSTQTAIDIKNDPKVEILASHQVDAYKKALNALHWQTGFRAESAISDDKLAAMNAIQLKTISAISTDKARLMDGESTDNVSVRGMEGYLRSEVDIIRKKREELMKLL